MKTLVISAIIASVTATASFANNGSGTATWGGDSGVVHGSGDCQFKKNQAGTMSYDDATMTWNTTSNAVVVLKVRNTNNVKVESDNKLRTTNNTAVADVVVNYLPQSTISVKGKNDATTNRNSNSLTAGNLKKNGNGVTKVTFSIGGKATMTEDETLNINDDTDYKINHTVTCLQ
jgi:hypothetical protein